MSQNTGLVNNNTKGSHTLVTIAFSHYNERARWALDLAGIPYREVAYFPIFHMLPVLIRQLIFGGEGKKDAASSPLSTPMLVLRRPTGPALVLTDSVDIIRYADEEAGLFARETTRKGRQEEVDQKLEKETETLQLLHNDFGEVLGPAVRSYGYSAVLFDFSLYCSVAWNNSTPGIVQRIGWVLFSPLIILSLRGLLRAGPQYESKCQTQIRGIFARVGALLADGRPFLGGSKMSELDISFAALSAPVMCISKSEGPFGGRVGVAWLPPLEAMPERMQTFAKELRATPAGEHVLKMYQQYRKPL
jgi:glutathione S-transferase